MPNLTALRAKREFLLEATESLRHSNQLDRFGGPAQLWNVAFATTSNADAAEDPN
ncbi:MAG: hypothetical protein AAF585_02350 [Verrucomicrobiota bacterium]